MLGNFTAGPRTLSTTQLPLRDGEVHGSPDGTQSDTPLVNPHHLGVCHAHFGGGWSIDDKEPLPSDVIDNTVHGPAGVHALDQTYVNRCGGRRWNDVRCFGADPGTGQPPNVQRRLSDELDELRALTSVEPSQNSRMSCASMSGASAIARFSMLLSGSIPS